MQESLDKNIVFNNLVPLIITIVILNKLQLTNTIVDSVVIILYYIIYGRQMLLLYLTVSCTCIPSYVNVYSK